MENSQTFSSQGLLGSVPQSHGTGSMMPNEQLSSSSAASFKENLATVSTTNTATSSSSSSSSHHQNLVNTACNKSRGVAASSPVIRPTSVLKTPSSTLQPNSSTSTKKSVTLLMPAQQYPSHRHGSLMNKKKNNLMVDVDGVGTSKNTRRGTLSPTGTTPSDLAAVGICWAALAGLASNLKPIDWITLTYLLGTLPLCFVSETVEQMVWQGIALRLLLVPAVIFFRTYFQQTSYPILFSQQERKLSGRKSGFLAGLLPELDVGRLYWVVDWYVGGIFLYLYSEEGLIIHNLYGNFSYDPEVQEWEQKLFLSQPSQDLRVMVPGLWLGEYLHVCYFAFYFIIAIVGVAVYFRRPRESFDQGVCGLALAFYTCFTIYFLFPVKGPFHEFTRPNPEDVGLYFSHAVHWLLVRESSQGTATPSSHCAIAVACWTLAYIYHKPTAFGYIFVVPGLVVATVWCGFHYAIDAVLGCIIGFTACYIGMRFGSTMKYNVPYNDRWAYQSLSDKGNLNHKKQLLPTHSIPVTV